MEVKNAYIIRLCLVDHTACRVKKALPNQALSVKNCCICRMVGQDLMRQWPWCLLAKLSLPPFASYLHPSNTSGNCDSATIQGKDESIKKAELCRAPSGLREELHRSTVAPAALMILTTGQRSPRFINSDLKSTVKILFTV